MSGAHSHPILLDFESRSRCDLKVRGGRNYWQDASTEALCCAWYDTYSGEVGVWMPGEAWPHRGRVLAAHNMMGFDRFAAERAFGKDACLQLIDTSDLAKRAGLPGALDALGTRWAGIPKDAAGSKFTKSLSAVRRPSKGTGAIPTREWAALTSEEKRARGQLKSVTPEALSQVVDYCLSDVEILAETWDELSTWLDAGEENDVLAAHRQVNDRGVRFDVELARRLIECDEQNGARVVREVARELGVSEAKVRAQARSNEQFCEETGASNAQKATVAELSHPLARARQALNTITAGKLRAGLARVSLDGRIRDSHVYYGGHTGRWSSRGMQLHNLPRPAKAFEAWGDDEVCDLVDRVLSGYCAAPDEITLLVRACLCASEGKRLAVCDFKGVEARMLAWCAGDHKALEIFRADGDPYKAMASTIFGVPVSSVDKIQRTVGKIAELACGYGMGAPKFEWTAAQAGVDLGAMGIDARKVVLAWRKQHAPSARFWQLCEDAFVHAYEGHASRVSCFAFLPGGRDIAIALPTSRLVVYPEVHLCESKQRPGALELSYLGTKGREHTYGGKIVENITQAICRELLAGALVRAEKVGLDPVLHVHDEPVCEVPASCAQESFDELRECMLALPDWAAGFPVGCDGFVARRYRK